VDRLMYCFCRWKIIAQEFLRLDAYLDLKLQKQNFQNLPLSRIEEFNFLFGNLVLGDRGSNFQ
jgi:hypothetical protein